MIENGSKGPLPVKLVGLVMEFIACCFPYWILNVKSEDGTLFLYGRSYCYSSPDSTVSVSHLHHSSASAISCRSGMGSVAACSILPAGMHMLAWFPA